VVALASVAVVTLAGFGFYRPIRNLIVAAKTPDYHRPNAPTSGRASGAAPSGVRVVQVARGFQKPTDLQFVPGGGGLAVVVEQTGGVRTVDLSHALAPGAPVATPSGTVLEVAVRTDSEQGALGLAFHPKYAENGLFYLDWTPKDGAMRSRISEWHSVRADLGKSLASGERIILEVAQPYSNHKAGQLAFGPDGFLYVGFGDGGWRFDPHGNGQNPDVLLGKMLRLDVNSRASGAYGIPPDNPFIGRKGFRPEIWALGLRNPWRYSFDPLGRLVVGDVGQDRFEEIDLVAKGDNLGWNVREATHCFEPKEGCRQEGLVDPIYEYGRGAGQSVTGGYVYTGSAVPSLSGQYVFGDFVTGSIWTLKLPGQYLASHDLVEATLLGTWPLLVSSFGRDEQGEIYLVDYSEGGIYRLVLGP
jgi:glucose/arabinose dehydrogenase